MPHSLLSIPRELRDEILKLVLYSSRQPPDGPFYPTNRVQLHDLKYISLSHQNVSYERVPEWTIPAAQALFLVNHQLATETKAIISRSPLSYSLDLMVVEEHYLWPTWLSVPIESACIGQLTVNLRVFGSAPSPYQHTNAFRETGARAHSNGTPPAFANRFYSVLERILKRGACFPSTRCLTRMTKTAEFQRNAGVYGMNEEEMLAKLESILQSWGNSVTPDEIVLYGFVNTRRALSEKFTDRGTVIETLRLDCQTPSPWQGQRVAGPEVKFNKWMTKEYYTSQAALSFDQVALVTKVPVMRPEWLASYISSELEALLRLSFDTDWCAGIFYERIGRIQVCVDGVVVAGLELDSMLDGLQVMDPENFYGGLSPMEQRATEFRSWKQGTMRRRKENGLPVIDSEGLLLSRRDLLMQLGPANREPGN